MDKNIIRTTLEKANLEIISESRYRNYAWRFKLKSGTSVFCGDGGKIWCKGKQKDRIECILKDIKIGKNNQVFVVYGHDLAVREDLIKLLKEWKINALVIDDLPTQGRTIIEQLEHYIPQANFGIVLATPDDIGYQKDMINEAKLRARQNVVLELGMLFAKLGRKRVVIILKEIDNFERPSDIDGILYYSFKESVYELAAKLRNELNSNGYKIS